VHGRQIHCEPRLNLRGLRLWHLLGRAWLGLLALQVARYQRPLFASVIGGPLSGTDVACVAVWACSPSSRPGPENVILVDQVLYCVCVFGGLYVFGLT
jgi:hypothetical protein